MINFSTQHQAVRTLAGNSTQARDNILAVIRDPNTEGVVLFATVATSDDCHSCSSTNLPCVVALALIRTPGLPTLRVVCDNDMVTAQRIPRYGEVRTLLDQAEQSDKVFFSPEQVPLTMDLNPSDAANCLSAFASKAVPLTPATRSQYFSLLSSVSEAEFS